MKHIFLRRAGALLLAFTLVLSAAVTTAWAADPVPVTNITLSEYSLELPLGTSKTLTATVLPQNADDKRVSWSSTDSEVADVNDQGSVFAIKPGKATIMAASVENASIVAYCQVEVPDPTVPTITLNQTAVSLLVGHNFALKATVGPDPSVKVTWTTSNRSQVLVDDNGNLSALAQTSTPVTITASIRDNQGREAKATCTVTVRNADSLTADSLSAQGSTKLTLSTGQQMTLDVNVSPASAYVSWVSDTPRVVSVTPTAGSGAQIRAVGPGTAFVTATVSKRGGGTLSVEYEITVGETAGSVEFNEVGPIRFDLDDGRTRSVSVTVRPSDTNTYINWTSSAPTIVSVTGSEGSNTATLTVPGSRLAGRATITAAVYDKTSRQPVLGADGETPLADTLEVVVSGITLSETTLTMYEGEAKPLSIGAGYGEAEGTSAGGVRWNSSDPGVVTMENGSLNAWSKGTAVITATTIADGYTATCTVSVVEDAGTIVSAGTVAAGNSIKLGTGSVISQINRIANERAGGAMDYISGIFISPNQGVVYNTYTSDADTGAGVSMGEKYYINRSTPASEYIGALSFVPNKSFSGEARITYIGRANGRDISGVISVNVSGMGEGGSDVMYTANAAPVTFQAEDFNIICVNKTGRTLKYVTFTPPSANMGTLYENYTNESHPGQKVVATTQYNRTSAPNLSSVTFVPAEGYSGTVTISYRAVDSANTPYTGRVTITVSPAASTTESADIYYTAPQDGWVTFRTADFAYASTRTIGETLSHVRFSLPSSSEGTLFYNYRGFGDYDSAVTSTTNYYQSGTPDLGGVTYVPATTFSGRTAITYTGYSTRGTTFTGKVYVSEGPAASQPGTGTGTGSYTYTVSSGSSVNLNANYFNSACIAATGAYLNYIRFTSLPAVGQGTLRYRTGSSSYYSDVSTYTTFYRTGTPQISGIYFLANRSYTGVVHIPYTGYDINGVSFMGEITIQVTPNTIVYTGTTASSIQLSSSRIRSAVSASFNQALSYIEFTSLPSSTAGYLYTSYNGTQVRTGVRYYASSVPSIDQLSFVPANRFAGDATAVYTAYSTSGETMAGQIIFRISSLSGSSSSSGSGSASSYFTDMSSHAWAAAAVDYLYRNNVVNGVTPTTFGPGQQVLRRDFVLMLYRAFYLSGGSSTNTGFADVPANAYYSQAVSAAKQLGIISGDGRNFRPASPITRQDAMVMVVNTMRAVGRSPGSASTTVLNRFPDGYLVSDYAREAVSTLVQMGAVSGSNGMLNPRASISRAEAAVILQFVMTA